MNAFYFLLCFRIVGFLRDFVRHQTRGIQFRQRIREHELNRLIICNRFAKLHARFCKFCCLINQTRGCPTTPRRNHYALVAEPLFAQFQTAPDAAQYIRVRHAHIVQSHARMFHNQVVHVFRIINNFDTARIQIHKKQSIAVADIWIRRRLHHRVIRNIARSEMPFFAVQNPIVAVARRRRIHHARVRTMRGFRNGITIAARSFTRRTHKTFHLLIRRVFQNNRGVPHHPTERVRCLAHLFIHNRLLHPRKAASAKFAGQANCVQFQFQHARVQPFARRVVQFPFRQFRLHLKRNQFVVHKTTRFFAQ